MNVHEFLRGVGLWIRNILLDFLTDPHPNLDPGSLFHFPSLRDRSF